MGVALKPKFQEAVAVPRPDEQITPLVCYLANASPPVYLTPRRPAKTPSIIVAI